MILALLLLAQSGVSMDENGAEIYARTCANAFCHGPAGTAGRAAALVGRNLPAPEIRRAVIQGISSKGMPAFGKQLSRSQVDAVVAYVRSLRGAAPVLRPPISNPGKLSEEGQSGRDLFFDSARMPNCGACHAVGTMGADMAAKLTAGSSLSGVATPRVKTAVVDGESFPAIVERTTDDSIRLWDLASPLPVLRTFPRFTVQINDRSTWNHSDAVGRYTRAELDLIFDYIRVAQ